MQNFVQEHFSLLKDQSRVAAYRRAIEATVRPGDVVLDIGSGTGVMGLLACKAGAARVYSVELSGMVEVTRKIVKANGFGDRMICLHGGSTQIELPERVDVAIADQTGPFAIGGGEMEVFNDAHRRFLKPGARTIPLRIDLQVALMECPQAWAVVGFWDEMPAGFDMSAMRGVACNLGYGIACKPEKLLSEPARTVSFELNAPTPRARAGTATLVASRAGTFHGLCGWFNAELAPSISISNSPLAADAIDRRVWFMPVERPVTLRKGDTVSVMTHLVPAEETVTWQVEVAEGNGGSRSKFTQSTLKSILVAKEELEKMKPDFMPRRSGWGEVRRIILELCDGAHTVSQIEEEVYLRGREVFSSPEQAQTAVTRTIAKNSR